MGQAQEHSTELAALNTPPPPGLFLNSDSISLSLQLKGNLERTIQEQNAELEQATAAMHAAEAEAAAQEELAELASGELEEYQRRMAAEVQHARQEALRAVSTQTGGTGLLQLLTLPLPTPIPGLHLQPLLYALCAPPQYGR